VHVIVVTVLRLPRLFTSNKVCRSQLLSLIPSMMIARLGSWLLLGRSRLWMSPWLLPEPACLPESLSAGGDPQKTLTSCSFMRSTRDGVIEGRTTYCGEVICPGFLGKRLTMYAGLGSRVTPELHASGVAILRLLKRMSDRTSRIGTPRTAGWTKRPPLRSFWDNLLNIAL
jgi:hypothetical protein